ncbi:MAG: uroporphyrinogen decarboxylase family protein [Planctomycetota bacterium]
MMSPAATSSRDRVRQALNHQEPDRVPFDLSSTQVTTISNAAYVRLRRHLELPPAEPNTMDVVQQVCVPHDDVMQRFQVDTRGVFPLVSVNWNVDIQEEGDERTFVDEWHCKYRMPKNNGCYFSLCASPLDGAKLTRESVDRLDWPDPADPQRWADLREQAERFRDAGYAAVLRGLCAGILEMACRLRPMDTLLMDLAMGDSAAIHLLAKLTELKGRFWEAALDDLGDVVDVVVEADDYGTQQSMLVSPEMYRRLLKPLQAELFRVIRQRLPDGFIFFHSCGNVRTLIPDFIEIGVDILNPVHVKATGMEPKALKRDFGRDISFWGGGVDTQGVLPHGTTHDVREDVRRNVSALAPGGGYIFNTVHNIQADVPPENIVAMLEAFAEVRDY